MSINITDDEIAELTEDFTAVLNIPAEATSQGIIKGADSVATIEITDNDPVEVVFSPAQYNVNEEGGAVVLTLKASRPASFDYIVDVDTVNGAAIG